MSTIVHAGLPATGQQLWDAIGHLSAAQNSLLEPCRDTKHARQLLIAEALQHITPALRALRAAGDLE